MKGQYTGADGRVYEWKHSEYGYLHWRNGACPIGDENIESAKAALDELIEEGARVRGGAAMTLDRQAARQRCEAATEGPWWWAPSEADEHDGIFRHGALQANDQTVLFGAHERVCSFAISNLDFAAHARQDLPAALDELDAKDAEVERLRGALEEIRFVAPCGSWTPEQEALYERALGGES